ncbi:carbamoyltransferase HypF [Solihabitans fulvus]|uniref:Carbamoyltransferase n=1 Tax=Solihabitans fulvus TaxID=1892852 RepID=A0A5B2XKC8_9PSEU|nr:carbamoyltransferase HypF [Solihabitans fulvus]
MFRATDRDARRRLRCTVTGVVQGVGFRPFVHRLATELALTGFVGNDALAVFVEVQGSGDAVAAFERRLTAEAPPLSAIAAVVATDLPTADETGFAIVASTGGSGARTLVPPDVATCGNCLAELADPADRRYRHPFITCTDCGPRFTIIRDLPYDRPATTMTDFPMCAACAGEYEDPADRRFHAQPVACPDCGPVLWFTEGGARVDGADAAIAAAQRALLDGRIVAVKGIGGYHLACRADSDAAIARLRERKARDQKPFALLARDLAVARGLARIDAAEEHVLTCPARPIVLLRRRFGAPVAEAVAPGNPLLGVLLPYTPVHHLLFAPVPGSTAVPPELLVMTSANLSDEPLCFDDLDAAARLPRLADAVLTHDRPIHVPCDDSVVRVVDGAELPIRRSRGYAPLPVALGRELPPTLAVGGELKNTCCLVDGRNAFCSAHIGDMGNAETTRAFERAVDQLTTLHRLRPEVLAADAHPAYLTRAWAERHAGEPGEPALRFVQHHHAHVVSLLAEHGRIGEPVIGVAFDGTGFGADAAVWGGEILVLGNDTARYRRAGHLLPVSLPGGDAAVRNPCRMALAYLDAAGVPLAEDLPPVAACGRAEFAGVRSLLASGVGTVSCTSMGRLFDAVAALLGVRQRIGYEAQAAIELEIRAQQAQSIEPDGVEPLRFAVRDGVLDHRPVIRGLVAGLRAGEDPGVAAYRFHLAIADAVADCVGRIARDTGIRSVGLTGGVFQNVLLAGACRDRLEQRGLTVLTHHLVPPNDGGLALGQAVVAALAEGGSRADTPTAPPLGRS